MRIWGPNKRRSLFKDLEMVSFGNLDLNVFCCQLYFIFELKSEENKKDVFI